MSFQRQQAVLRVTCLLIVLSPATVTVTLAEEDGRLELLSRQHFEQVLESSKGKLVMPNLWATWCVPCLKEIPELMRLEDALRDSGFTLLAVGMDDPADVARVDAFRRQHFPRFSSYLRDTSDMDSMVSVVDPAWNELLPTSYLIDRNGQVVSRMQGKKTFDEFFTAISALLQEGL